MQKEPWRRQALIEKMPRALSAMCRLHANVALHALEKVAIEGWIGLKRAPNAFRLFRRKLSHG